MQKPLFVFSDDLAPLECAKCRYECRVVAINTVFRLSDTI